MIALFAIIGGVGALALLFYAFLHLSPAALAYWLKRGALVVLGGAALVLVFRGQIGLAFLLGSLLPLLNRMRTVPGFGQVGGGGAGGAGGGAGQASEIETAWLRMRLDHASGGVSGEVLQGAFRGRRLADLTLEELIRLRQECAHDPQSVNLIEAFLDRTHAGAWRAGAGGGEEQAGGGQGADSAGGEAAMSTERACAILGLAAEASQAEIREAHRRLMKKVHPDQGGSNYLAGEINAAKDFLLKRRRSA